VPAAPMMTRERLLARFDGDEPLIRQIAGVFLDDYPEQLAQIRAAVVAGDAVRLERAAHALKGALGNFGAEAAVAAACQLEALARSRNLTGTERVSLALEEEIARLQPLLESLRGDAET